MSEEFISFEKSDDHCRIYVCGEVDLSNSTSLRKTILAALKSSEQVTVHLNKVDYIDSSGIAAMVEGLQMANNNNKTFSLAEPSKQVRSILELARLDTVFTID